MRKCAESMRVMRPLFQAGEGGSTPTSALQLFVERCHVAYAKELNCLWHSRFPKFADKTTGGAGSQCYVATHDGITYAVAIWTHPIVQSLPQNEWLELRRLAIAPDAPKNTASRMLRVMAILLRKSHPWVTRLISYQDTEVHTGTIYRAAGWQPTTLSDRSAWDTRPGRVIQSDVPKRRWEKQLRGNPYE